MYYLLYDILELTITTLQCLDFQEKDILHIPHHLALNEPFTNIQWVHKASISCKYMFTQKGAETEKICIFKIKIVIIKNVLFLFRPKEMQPDCCAE